MVATESCRVQALLDDDVSHSCLSHSCDLSITRAEASRRLASLLPIEHPQALGALQEWTQQARQVFCEFDPERPPLPLLPIERITVDHVTLIRLCSRLVIPG